MVYGVQPGTFYFIPMLGDKHAEEYPRFRDCFLGRTTRDADTDEMGIPLRKTDYPDTRAREVTVYTGVGGGNRESYAEDIEILRAMPTYITDYDDQFDSTFASFVFGIPEQWHSDFDKIVEGKLDETSKKYQAQVDKVYPKLQGKMPWHNTSGEV